MLWDNRDVARPTPKPSSDVTVYSFSQALLVRTMGLLLALAGGSVFLVAVLVVVVQVPGVVLTVVVVLAALGVLAGVVLLARMRGLVRFDADGYQVRVLRGAGVKQARWRDVEDAVTTVSAGQDCVVLRLRDGRSTTIPVGVLDVSADAFVQDLRGRLDTGHGYRRLR